MKSAVTISMVEEAQGGPFVYWHDLPTACRKARKLGFNGVEIFPPGPDAIDIEKTRKILADNGLALAAMGTGAGWVKHRLHLTHADASVRKKAKDFVRSIIDVAGALSAPAIIGSMQGRAGEGVDHPTALGYLGEALGELGAYAAAHNVPLLFEPLNRYETNLVNSIKAGLALLESVQSPNVKLLADLFHMNIEETDLARALAKGGDKIGHLHFVDSNRRPAGLGHIDFALIAKALRQIEYKGFLSAEALSYPHADAAAEQTILCFNSYFRSA